jgi:hypothetical protein
VATSIGAFLSGAAAVISSIWALRSLRKRQEKACLERIEEVRRSIHEGYEMGKK